MDLPIVEVSGSSYEIGYQHGTKAKDKIKVTIDLYKNMFKEFADIDWETAQKIALKFEKNIQNFNGDYLDEIKGIADGSGYKYEEILALNTRSEIVFQGTHLTSDGCTSLVVTSEKTDTNGTYLAQNWDWKVKIFEGVILLKIKKEGKPAIATMTEAGIIGKIGCNSYGIGVCFNALSVNGTPKGVPIHIILRDILEQPTFLMALSVASNVQIGCPSNILIASQHGEALDFEIEIDDFEGIYPDNGIILHTNHYISSKLPKDGRKDISKCKFPDTFIRYGRANKLIRAINQPITKEDIKMVLTDHSDPSVSICHHEEKNRTNGDVIGTIFSIIMDLKAKEFYVSFGQPCENEYKKYTVN